MPPRPVTGPPPHPSFFLARRPPEGPAVAGHRHRSDRLPPRVSDLVARFSDLLPAPRCLRPYGPAVSSGLPPSLPWFSVHGHRRHPPGRGAPPARPSSGRRCLHAILRCSPPRAAAPHQLVLPAPPASRITGFGLARTGHPPRSKSAMPRQSPAPAVVTVACVMPDGTCRSKPQARRPPVPRFWPSPAKCRHGRGS
nr:WW domain-binding protein 11-like [Aegilops tauschii subsp. strangulata]